MYFKYNYCFFEIYNLVHLFELYFWLKQRLDRVFANTRNVSFQLRYDGQFTSSITTQLINPKICVLLPHRRSTTVSKLTPLFTSYYGSPTIIRQWSQNTHEN